MIGLDLLWVSVLTGPWLHRPHGCHDPLDFAPSALLEGADQKVHDQWILQYAGLAPRKPLECSDSSACDGLRLILHQKDVGGFAAAMASGEAGLQVAEAVAHPASLVYACLGVGLPYLRQSAYDKALPLLVRAVTICQEADLRFHFPGAVSHLGAAYALCGRVAEAIGLLEQAVERDAAMGRRGNQARKVALLGEAYVLAGHLEQASDCARRALDLARTHKERGYEAYALRLLGEIAAQRHPLDTTTAEGPYREALALAEALGMRPLVAHCHHGLGMLYAKSGQWEQARTGLSAAIALYRVMAMTFWLPQAETALARVEG
jgi:tetratricopeptide (TPR) repeat protein